MKKKFYLLTFSCICFFTIIIPVFAHPGRKDSNGCHTCKTNCEKYGLSYGQYHCHGTNSTSSSKKKTTTVSKNSSTSKKNNSTSKKSTSTPIKTTTKVAVSKSNDNSLKELYIDTISLNLEEPLLYETKEEEIEIHAVTNHSKAKVSIDSPSKLQLGSNKITIHVISESGNTRNYNLNVNRLPLSSNKNITIYIDNKEVLFNNYTSKLITIKNKQTSIDIHYKLEDQNSHVEIFNNKDLKVGENTITVKVTAEDKTTQNYLIKIERESDKLNFMELIIILPVCVAILSFLIYSIYFLLKKYICK